MFSDLQPICIEFVIVVSQVIQIKQGETISITLKTGQI